MSLRKVLSFFPSLIKILFHRIVCDRLRKLGASVQTAESYSRATKAFCLWVAAQVEVAENHNWHVSQHPIRSQKLCSIFESLCAPSWPLDAPWPLGRCPCQWTPPSPPKWASPSRRLPITAPLSTHRSSRFSRSSVYELRINELLHGEPDGILTHAATFRHQSVGPARALGVTHDQRVTLFWRQCWPGTELKKFLLQNCTNIMRRFPQDTVVDVREILSEMKRIPDWNVCWYQRES